MGDAGKVPGCSYLRKNHPMKLILFPGKGWSNTEFCEAWDPSCLFKSQGSSKGVKTGPENVEDQCLQQRACFDSKDSVTRYTSEGKMIPSSASSANIQGLKNSGGIQATRKIVPPGSKINKVTVLATTNRTSNNLVRKSTFTTATPKGKTTLINSNGSNATKFKDQRTSLGSGKTPNDSDNKIKYSWMETVELEEEGMSQKESFSPINFTASLETSKKVVTQNRRCYARKEESISSHGVRNQKKNFFAQHPKERAGKGSKIKTKKSPILKEKVLNTVTKIETNGSNKRKYQNGSPWSGCIGATPLAYKQTTYVIKGFTERIQVNRTREEKESNPHRIKLDRHGLKNFPVILGEGCELKLLSLQHNIIGKLENVPSCLNHLVVLDLYDNRIERITSLHGLTSLRVLLLGKNRIRKIEGLEGLRKLQILDLHGNQIGYMDNNASCLVSLRVLNLAGNQLRTIKTLGARGLPSLVEFNLKRNRLKSIEALSATFNVKKLFLANNELTSMSSIYCLKKLHQLEDLSLDGNPLTSHVEYETQVIDLLPWLKNLNKVRVTEEMKLKEKQNNEKCREKELESATTVSQMSATPGTLAISSKTSVSTNPSSAAETGKGKHEEASREQIIQEARRRWESVKNFVKNGNPNTSARAKLGESTQKLLTSTNELDENGPAVVSIMRNDVDRERNGRESFLAKNAKKKRKEKNESSENCKDRKKKMNRTILESPIEALSKGKNEEKESHFIAQNDEEGFEKVEKNRKLMRKDVLYKENHAWNLLAETYQDYGTEEDFNDTTNLTMVNESKGRREDEDVLEKEKESIAYEKNGRICKTFEHFKAPSSSRNCANDYSSRDKTIESSNAVSKKLLAVVRPLCRSNEDVSKSSQVPNELVNSLKMLTSSSTTQEDFIKSKLFSIGEHQDDLTHEINLLSSQNDEHDKEADNLVGHFCHLNNELRTLRGGLDGCSDDAKKETKDIDTKADFGSLHSISHSSEVINTWTSIESNGTKAMEKYSEDIDVLTSSTRGADYNIINEPLCDLDGNEESLASEIVLSKSHKTAKMYDEVISDSNEGHSKSVSCPSTPYSTKSSKSIHHVGKKMIKSSVTMHKSASFNGHFPSSGSDSSENEESEEESYSSSSSDSSSDGITSSDRTPSSLSCHDFNNVFQTDQSTSCLFSSKAKERIAQLKKRRDGSRTKTLKSTITTGSISNLVGKEVKETRKKLMRRCDSAASLTSCSGGTNSCCISNGATVATDLLQLQSLNFQPTPIKKQGADYLVEIDGKILSVYGHGALKHALMGFPQRVCSGVSTAKFYYITFDAIVPSFGKLKQIYPSLEHFQFRANNLCTLSQLNAFADLQGLTSLHICKEGNPLIQNPMWIPYAAYRLSHWGLTFVNCKEMAPEYKDECWGGQVKFMESLGFIALSCLPQCALTPLAKRLHSLHCFCGCSSTTSSEDSCKSDKKKNDDGSDNCDRTSIGCSSWDDDPVLLDVIGKEALVYMPPKNDLNEKKGRDETISCLVSSGIQILQKLQALEDQWPQIMRNLIQGILNDYLDMDGYKKSQLKRLQDQLTLR